MLVLHCCYILCFTAQQRYLNFFLLSLNIEDAAVSTSSSVVRVPKGEFDIEWLLNSMAVGGCIEGCIIYYCSYKKKITIKKANAELENITS